MDFNIKYLSWKTKVDSYVKYLTGENNYEFDNMKQFYNNGFEDKVVALIISKNIINKKNYKEYEWWEEIERVFSLFSINIENKLKSKILEENFPKNPFNIACKILKDYGYLSLTIFVDKEKEIDNQKFL